MVRIKNGLVFTRDEGFVNRDIYVDGGRITEIKENTSDEEIEVMDASSFYVVPGYIDIHTHGVYGYDAMTASCEDLDRMSLYYASRGVTSFLPTTITLPVLKIVKALENISSAMQKGTQGAEILGINLEGPFVNRKFKGSHPEEYIMHPTVEFMDSLIRKSGGNIRMVTFAPEQEGAMEIAEHFKGSGITFAIGHSELNSSGAREVFGKGITHVTHLFNAMTGFHHREPGLAGAALDNEDVTVEIICDGIHINPSVVRIIMKCKPPEKVAIITDSTIAAGLEDGEYYLWDRPITVRNSEARLNNGVLSGSTLTMEDAVKNMVNKFGIPLEDTIIMASETPARVAGVSSRKGGISPGRDADIVFLDDSLNVRLTMVKGRVVYSNL